MFTISIASFWKKIHIFHILNIVTIYLVLLF